MNSELHDYGSVVLSDANSGLRSNAEIANSSGGTALTDNRARVPELPEPSRKRGRGPMLSSRRALPPGVSFNVDETAREVQSAFRTFILQFSNNGENVYCDQIHHMVANDITTLYVDATHVALFHQDLSDAIRQEFYRFETALRSALDSVVKELHPEHSLNEERSAEIYHKEYYVSMYNLENVSKIREIRADMIGQLISISGTVTRTSEVRPELISGTFACNQCSQIIKDVQQQFVYSTPNACPNLMCNNTKGFELIVDQSRFADWQKIRVQENSNEIPPGSMPRTLQVIVRNEMVERAKPGDKVVFTGCAIAIPDVGQLSGGVQSNDRSESRIAKEYEGVTGLRNLGVRDLTYKIAFLGCGIQAMQARSGDFSIRNEDDSMDHEFTEEERREIYRMSQEPRLYTRLASCISPTVYGHEEIKRGILLMLLGGVHKSTPDAGMNLRGDINICLIGDPSTAKSQFLKYVVSFLPRAVYTSGKASSAAGLTASVARDPETGEYGIEAGALLLADNGICCIDEFDKMDPKDQVAIHEAMEQQTISIAKAGIQATLNARASILAAANPIFGRYDLSKTLKQNMNITAPIMSRFDLFYVVVDQCDPVLDLAIAQRIVGVHQDIEETSTPEFSVQQMQKYIAFARTIKPKMTQESAKLLATHYSRLRENDVSGASKSSYRITVRQLESMIRLSEALARLHLNEEILPQYVDEAARLIRTSIVRVQSEELTLDDLEGDVQKEPQNVDEEDEDVRMEGADEGIEGDSAEREGESNISGNKKEGNGENSKKVKISFEQYRRIANRLVLHLRQQGEISQQTYSRDELANWYLNEREREGALASISEVEKENRLIRRVIRRLVDQDHVLVEASENNIIVHPNYDMDNDDPVHQYD